MQYMNLTDRYNNSSATAEIAHLDVARTKKSNTPPPGEVAVSVCASVPHLNTLPVLLGNPYNKN